MTKQEILNNEIKDEPFYLSENLEPYIYKAMEIYAEQYHKEQVTLGLPYVSGFSDKELKDELYKRGIATIEADEHFE